MTTFDDLIATSLRETCPRANFERELRTALLHAATRPRRIDEGLEESRTRWIVACGIAGVVSATGVAYLGVRIHHRHKGVA